MTKYIMSKMTSNVNYTIYAKAPSGLPVVKQIITVRGGADVIDKKTLVTPEGVLTVISDDEYNKLYLNPIFRRHLERGMISVSSNETNAEKTSKTLTKDTSAQLTPKDYRKNGKNKPKTEKEYNGWFYYIGWWF